MSGFLEVRHARGQVPDIYLHLGGELLALVAAALGGAERVSRSWQGLPNRRCERVRAPKHAPRRPFYLHERRHGRVEIVERGATVLAFRVRVARRALGSRKMAIMSPSRREGGIVRGRCLYEPFCSR